MNYMLRVPLWPTARRTSHPIGPTRATAIPVVDVHELTAGKLCALLTRQAGRDLFDAHLLLTQGNLDEDRLRLAFVVYGGMSRRDWRTVSTEDLSFEEEELNSTLVPLLRRTDSGPAADLSSWATSLVGECRALLSRILPFTDAEREFLNRLLDQGHVEPSFLTRDEELAERIRQQPMLKWKALHVRQFKGKSA